MLLGRYLQLLLLIDICLSKIRLLFLRSYRRRRIAIRRSTIIFRMHFIFIIFCPIVGRI